MAVIAEPQIDPRRRNDLSVVYSLYTCGCGCRCVFPSEGPRSCPIHGGERVGWTRYPKGHPRGPW
jgi:hypothetical protein